MPLFCVKKSPNFGATRYEAAVLYAAIFFVPHKPNTKKDFRFHHSRAFEFKENFACIQTIIYSMVRVATDHKHNANSFETEKIWPNTYSDEMKPKEKIMLEK